MVSAVMFPDSGSTSAKIGVAPTLTTEEMEAIKVLGVTITSSPDPISRAQRAASRANVPLAKAIE